MKKMLTLVLAAAAFGCAHGPDKRLKNYGEGEGLFHNGKAGESVQAKLMWTKNKPKAVDVNMTIQNNSKKAVFLRVHTFQAEINGEKSMEVRPDYSIQLEPGDSRSDIIAFRFAQDGQRTGNVKITLPVTEGTLEKEGKPAKPVVIEVPVVAVE